MSTNRIRVSAALGAAFFACAVAAEAQPIPARPEALTYGPLKFEVPAADRFRHELPGGVVAYVVPDRALPLVNIVLHLRTGSFREPQAKPGLASMTASLMRLGGTATRTPEEFDERADFLAAQVGSGAGATGAQVSLNVLSTSLDDGLDLLFYMLRNPRFDDGRLAIEKGKALEAMKQRNDDAGTIQSREWGWLLYGRDHFTSRKMTGAELESITRADLADFHRRTYGIEGMRIAVSGDVDAKTITANLARRLAGFSAAEKAEWPPRAPQFEPKAGLYHVEKDIPQGKVSMGHRSFQVVPGTGWADPDLYAIEIMDFVLGAGGFSSRLLQRVRSDEGLAYGAGSNFGVGTFWPGVFNMGYASKNPTVAYAMEILLEELERIRREPVTAEELALAKNASIDSFPRAFESAAQIAGTFVQDDLVGRPHSYWTAYRERIQAVTIEQVQAAAQKYLKPESLVTLVVGKWDEIAPGDPQGRAAMAQFSGGKVEHLPLRDPLTLAPLAPTPPTPPTAPSPSPAPTAPNPPSGTPR